MFGHVVQVTVEGHCFHCTIPIVKGKFDPQIVSSTNQIVTIFVDKSLIDQ